MWDVQRIKKYIEENGEFGSRVGGICIQWVYMGWVGYYVQWVDMGVWGLGEDNIMRTKPRELEEGEVGLGTTS